MRLVIAEKPSVAMGIAQVLGATAWKEGHMEGNGWLVSWCVGHLAGLAEPAAYDPKYDKWRREDLPILPENWRFTIGRDKRERFDVLRTPIKISFSYFLFGIFGVYYGQRRCWHGPKYR